jgi:UDP-N-acetylglucosamine acyltransferase
MTIHKTAVCDPQAQIHDQAEIGPYAVIGPNVKIGRGTTIGAHVVIDGHTTIGEDCRIFAGAIIGLEPQDLHYKNEPTGVVIGNRVTIRECVTIHRATGEGFTEIGDDCFLMAYNHIAHNCKLGKGVIMANSNGLAGHVTIGDYTVMSGMCVFHQHVRVGRMAMLSAMTGTRSDLPPFATIDGRPAAVRGVNSIGLKRNGVSLAVRSCVKEAYRLLYRSGLNTSQALTRIEEEIEQYPEIKEIVEFYRTSKRGVAGLCKPDAEILEEVPADAI